MEMTELEPQDAPPEFVGCPVCGRSGRVQRVSAAVAEGWRLPAPVPPTSYEWSPLLALLGIGGIGWTGLSMLNGSGVTDVTELVVAAWLAISGSRKSLRVFRRRKRIGAGKTAALESWNEAWLCAHCGIVYFQPGYEPAGVPLNRPLSYEQFKAEVYGVGGYRDLADGGKG